MIPYYFLSLSLLRYFISVLLFLLNFLIPHQKLFSKINCHSPNLLFFPFFSALQISQDSLFLLLFSSSTFSIFLMSFFPLSLFLLTTSLFHPFRRLLFLHLCPNVCCSNMGKCFCQRSVIPVSSEQNSQNSPLC